ncbi:MAG: hypothetical protein ACYDCL_01350 [Myxococcales bacterium]
MNRLALGSLLAFALAGLASCTCSVPDTLGGNPWPCPDGGPCPLDQSCVAGVCQAATSGGNGTSAGASTSGGSTAEHTSGSTGEAASSGSTGSEATSGSTGHAETSAGSTGEGSSGGSTSGGETTGGIGTTATPATGTSTAGGSSSSGSGTSGSTGGASSGGKTSQGSSTGGSSGGTSTGSPPGSTCQSDSDCASHVCFGNYCCIQPCGASTSNRCAATGCAISTGDCVYPTKVCAQASCDNSTNPESYTSVSYCSGGDCPLGLVVSCAPSTPVCNNNNSNCVGCTDPNATPCGGGACCDANNGTCGACPSGSSCCNGTCCGGACCSGGTLCCLKGCGLLGQGCA